MTFAYTYRSSDGQRHSAEIEAESRDAAFAKVRGELGIKPIKVTAAEGGAGRAANVSAAPRGGMWRLVAAAVLFAAVFGGAWWWLAARGGRGAEGRDAAPAPAPAPAPEAEDGYRQETREAFLKLVERAGALEDRCRAELTLLKLDHLHDYAWIARERDLMTLYRELEKAQSIIDYTRAQAKDLFRDVYRQFPAASANERTDAQRRYGKLMDEIDAEEERMQSEHLMLLLLDDHRDAWHVERGAISFTDEKVKEEFLFYAKPTDGSTARWKRDFGQSGIESPVVEVPPGPSPVAPSRTENSLPQPTE